jgi:hypothetical protein
MKLIKPALIGIIGLSLVVTFISFLLPSEAHGRRGIVIQADRNKILTELNDLYNWQHWHPDFNKDSSKLIFGKVTGVMDGRCDVTKKSGKMDIYTFRAFTDTSVTVIQKRKGENDVEHLFTLSTDATTGGTYVDWKLITKLKWYPWEKFSGFFTESFAAPGMELALDSLKAYTER